MIIAQISDTHICECASDKDQRIADFEAAIHDINQLDSPIDLVIHTGDVTHNGTLTEYQEAKRILDSSRYPYFVMPGNRDNRGNLTKAFDTAHYQNMQNTFFQYSLDIHDVTLIMLDSVSTTSNKGEFCEVRNAHFEELLNSPATTLKIVFSHHPPFGAHHCPDPYQFQTTSQVLQLHKTLSKFHNVLGLICGHVHRFDIGRIGSLPAFAMPSIATTLRWGDYPDSLRNRPVYQLIQISDDGTLSVETKIVEQSQFTQTQNQRY